MATLYCTNAILKRAKFDAVPSTGKANGPTLGNWYVTYFKVKGGSAVLYMSDRTFLTFIMTEGQRITAQKISLSLIHGINFLLPALSPNPRAHQSILNEYVEGSFAKARDLSILGSLTSYSLDYQQFIEEDGGLQKCSISDLIYEVNIRPNKRLKWATPWETTTSLLTNGIAT